jgi:hypothetical protein
MMNVKDQIKDVVKQVENSIRNNVGIGTHYIQCDAQYFLAMSKCDDGLWDIALTTLENRYKAPRIHIEEDKIVSWVCAAMNCPD